MQDTTIGRNIHFQTKRAGGNFGSLGPLKAAAARDWTLGAKKAVDGLGLCKDL